MSIFDDIESLEQKLQSELAKAGSYSSVDDFVKAYTQSIVDALSGFSPEQLSNANLDRIVDDALQNARDIINSDLAGQIQTSTRQVLTDTKDFYSGLGLSLPNLNDAVQRSKDAEALTNLFRTNMSKMREELLEGTIDTLRREIAQGLINRSDMEDLIFQYADGKAHFARVNAKMIVSSYNRIGREQVRDSAGLKDGLYYGDARANTRPFCLRCIGRVFTLEQIQKMDNGQLSPVKIYAGGWNCIHSWLWVDPEWDDELKEKQSDAEIVEFSDDYLNLSVPNT